MLSNFVVHHTSQTLLFLNIKYKPFVLKDKELLPTAENHAQRSPHHSLQQFLFLSAVMN